MPISDYKKIEKLGEGVYGVVYKAINKNTNEVVAIKKIKETKTAEGIPSTTLREVVILKSINHDNIIKLYDVIHSENSIYLIFEYINTDLKKLIEQRINMKRHFSLQTIKNISYQLLSALSFCHSKGIFHRDIKPENILINESFNIKLADFGLARTISIPLRKYTQEIVTLWYRPPELLAGEEYYDASVDIWSIACIIYELYTLETLFRGTSEINQLEKILEVLGPVEADDESLNNFDEEASFLNNENKPNTNFNKKLSNAYKKLNKLGPAGLKLDNELLIDLLMGMLKYNSLDRMTAEDALYHDFFTKQ